MSENKIVVLARSFSDGPGGVKVLQTVKAICDGKQRFFYTAAEWFGFLRTIGSSADVVLHPKCK